MKPGKRGRSPSSDCEECLPISKRITRLNIQASNRQSVEEKEVNEFQHHHQHQPSYSEPGCSLQNDMCAKLPWQQNGGHLGVPLTVECNNNDSCPCSSHQCHSDLADVNKSSVQAYAVHHSLPKADLNGYKPFMNEAENPHYYQINSLLYQAHLEKASRVGNSLKQ